MKIKTAGFTTRLDVDVDRKNKLKMTPVFLAETTVKMELPLTELRNTECCRVVFVIGWPGVGV